MIDINLVPLHLRSKTRRSLFGGENGVPLEIVIGYGGGLLAFLVVVHVIFLAINISKIAQHKILQSEWETIRPSKEDVDSVVNDMRMLQGKYKAVEDILNKGGVPWSQKLNVLSDSLPRGVWLKKITLKDEMFFIEGSAISKDSNEIISVHHYTSALKESKDFLDHFTDLELGSIQRRRIKNVEIADFVITIKLK